MSRKQIGWFMAMAMLTLLVAVSAPAFPMQEADPKPKEQANEGGGAVETILREQEQLLSGQRFSYDPAGRRDPFRSLVEPAGGIGPTTKRPPGVQGMMVAEVSLTGVVKDSRKGDIAMVRGSDNRGYFLRVGDQLFDATVISVDSRRGAVTFRQQVDDPRMIKPYRDVTKSLEPLEESADE